MASFNPQDYKPGDIIYIASSAGWNRLTVSEWTVTKVTPSGQIACDKGRLTSRGNIVGHNEWSSSRVVSPEKAIEIRKEERQYALWKAVERANLDIVTALRNFDLDGLKAAQSKLAQAIDAIEKERE